MDDVITIEKLIKNYGQGRGLFDINLRVTKGEIVGLNGANGAGKSTIMRHIMGYIHSDQGKVSVNGLDSWSQGTRFKGSIGYVPGEISFPDVSTGADFLKIQASFKGMKDLGYMNKLIQKLAIDIKAPLKRMSKGMKQKMALVVAFMNKPDILILDEPTTGLDPLMRDTVIELMIEAKERGATVFISSHVMKEFEDAADRVAFIEKGKILEVVDMADISGEKSLKTYYISFYNSTDIKRFISKQNGVDFESHDNQVILSIYDNEVNNLIEELSSYKIKDLSQTSQTLEEYFSKNFRKRG
ncbi:ABC transporter ATP-binding protein [Lactococcus lactis]|uniref:ABC transporter ATP-binding protein n=1 Tax=Lactococcus lactis TaxID=1358 RepID=UPI00071D331B|nr:ABC transporter ATP-binding protein [Lactococcus lactis]KSU03100.1 ABC transporter ATP-binding protein [Lactococcus lactis subsp. lactis]